MSELVTACPICGADNHHGTLKRFEEGCRCPACFQKELGELRVAVTRFIALEGQTFDEPDQWWNAWHDAVEHARTTLAFNFEPSTIHAQGDSRC